MIKFALAALSGTMLLMTAPAAAQEFRIGQEVDADGTGAGNQWKRCIVIGKLPGAYQIRCLYDNNSTEYGGESWAKAAFVRRRGIPGHARISPDQAPGNSPNRTSGPGSVTTGQYRPGQIVLGGWGMIEAGWTRCQILQRMQGTDQYQVRCVNAFLDHYGRRRRTLVEGWLPSRWIKPNNPSFHPEWTIAAAAAAPAPVPVQARPADGAARAVRAGAYECWANGAARMNMNFTVTGAGHYRNASGAGTFTMGAGGQLRLTGPMLESLPDGFIVVYHEPGGRPTFSLRSPRGAEAAFCELPG